MSDLHNNEQKLSSSENEGVSSHRGLNFSCFILATA